MATTAICKNCGTETHDTRISPSTCEYVCRKCYTSEMDADNKRLRRALEHIIEYWNRDENSAAMSDALWHILETAEQALIREYERLNNVNFIERDGKMISACIHDVTSIKVAESRKQEGLEFSEESYTKRIVIQSKDGECSIALFADTPEALNLVELALLEQAEPQPE